MQFTKERLEEIAEDGFLRHGESKELARIALASREAEPAGIVRHIELRGPEHAAGIHVSLYSRLDDGIELYTAPPAPVSVPDERAAFNAWNNDEDLPIAGVGAKNAAWLGWQARAAMLQSFGNSEQLNSPVIPDGWVMVPVEPTANQWAAGMQAFDSGMDKVTRIYKAMLAAAPLREVIVKPKK